MDYLRQFELTAKRNQWDNSDKASALLSALDGTAPSILSEIDDISYTEVKQLLHRRFGPSLTPKSTSKRCETYDSLEGSTSATSPRKPSSWRSLFT